MTECTQTLAPFEARFPRQGLAPSEGSGLTTEDGSLSLREADHTIDWLRRVNLHSWRNAVIGSTHRARRAGT